MTAHPHPNSENTIDMTAPSRRCIDHWDEINHVIFALSGLMRRASQAQAELLLDHHCFEGYPQKLADELDGWVRRIRARQISLRHDEDMSR